MISCWTCTRTNDCKKLPDTIQQIKAFVCPKYLSANDEEVAARNTILTSVGPRKTIKVLKNHRRASMSLNPVVQKIIDLVSTGNVAAVQALGSQAEFINSHLMIAACKITDDPPGVSKQLADAKDDRRGKLIEILASAAAGVAPSVATAVASVPVVSEPVPEEEPKRRGRRPGVTVTVPASAPALSGDASTDALIARIDAVGQGQDELVERLKRTEESLRVATEALSRVMGTLDELAIVSQKLDLFKTGLLNAELEMLGAGKIASAPFGEAMEGWPKS